MFIQNEMEKLFLVSIIINANLKMIFRGTYSFEIDNNDDILYSKNNIKLLRKLWLDRKLINVQELGPGDEEEFENGAWHIACHLVAGSCVRRTKDDKLILLEISYNLQNQIYQPTLTIRENNSIISVNIHSEKAEKYIQDSKLLGFVEGTSEGRIAAKEVNDSSYSFAGNPRQNYNQEVGSSEAGGRVWEHWSTTRDIRESSKIGSSILDSYVLLVSVCGDQFVSIVARGRKDYFHPKQLKAMIETGFVSLKSTQLNIKPSVIPQPENLLFQEAETESSYLAIEKLDWDDPPKYYMYSRSINEWNRNQIY